MADAEAHPDNDLGGEDPSPERLLFQAWPAAPTAARVIRHWGGDLDGRTVVVARAGFVSALSLTARVCGPTRR